MLEIVDGIIIEDNLVDFPTILNMFEPITVRPVTICTSEIALQKKNTPSPL